MDPDDTLIGSTPIPPPSKRGFTLKLGAALAVAILFATGIVVGYSGNTANTCGHPLPYTVSNAWVTDGEFAPLYEWEGDTVVEPALVKVANVTHMFYRAGGWNGLPPVIGHAWLVNNVWQRAPFYLFGGSQPWVHHNDKFEIIYTHNGNVKLATSADAVYWTMTVLDLPRPSGFAGWGNRAMLNATVSKRGCDVLYQEVKIATEVHEIWEIFFYEHCDRYDLIGRMHLPKPHTCGMDGGITFEVLPTHTKAWFHAALSSGNLPTAVFSVVSNDMVNWHNLTCEIKVPFNHDQAADPIVEGGLLYYDVDDNVAQRARIRWARPA